LYSIRFAKESDAEEILGIYSFYIENTAVSFETVVPTVEEFRRRISKTAVFYPYIVIELDGKIIAYAYAAKHKERDAYRYNVETSVYIGHKFHGKKIGTALYTAIFEIARAQGIYNAYANITLPNDKSTKFHIAMGFTIIGIMHNTGYKFDEWHDVVCMEKTLIRHTNTPGEIRPIVAIDTNFKHDVLKRALEMIEE